MSNIISVSQFNTYIHDIILHEELLYNVQLYGEISGVSFSGNNMYFSIKDENAVLNCVKFGIKADEYLGQEGEMVLVRGTPNYYIKGGRFSFNVNKIEPYGQGLLYKQFLELKARLEALGLFNPEKKKKLPDVIKKIGVVTSETGAVIQDIIDISHRRNPLLNIVLYPAKVQGIGAENTIIKGIKELDNIQDVDVIIIARGGGSAEDLSVFNNESVAMAIADANKPIISAVGHETDFTIADFVADLRAPTPSAAAELVTINLEEIKAKMKLALERIIRLTDNIYISNYEKIANLVKYIDNNISLKMQENSAEFISLVNRLNNSSIFNMKNIEHAFDILVQKLEAVNPIKILRQGYSLVSMDGNLITSTKNIQNGDILRIDLQNGILKCEVKEKIENGD